MKRILVCMLCVLGLSVGLVGCGEKTSVQKTEKVTTPGGTDTKKTTVEETKTGDLKDNPPANP